MEIGSSSMPSLMSSEDSESMAVLGCLLALLVMLLLGKGLSPDRIPSTCFTLRVVVCPAIENERAKDEVRSEHSLCRM
jgi:hypothetical protein